MKINVPENMGPQPVPDFVYKASITKTEVKAALTGSLMVVCEYTILSEGNDPTQNTVGRKVFDNLVLQESTLWKVNIAVKAATGQNIPKGDYEIDELAGLISNLLLNKEVMLKIGTENIKREGVVTEDKRNVVKEIRAIA